MKKGSRKALVHWGGSTRVWGDAHWGQRLAAAWDASQTDDDTLTHGFHAYPARMHGGLARTIIRDFGRPGATLLDPFCGSGTTLVEAMVAGMQGIGVDLNPIALMVAAVKCERRSHGTRERFHQNLQVVVEASLQRVRKRIPIRAALSAAQRSFYEPHVLMELAGLQAEIEAVLPIEDRQAMKVLLSAIVVKFSRQRADTSTDAAAKRIGKGIPTRFWGRKGEELIARWEALEEACQAFPQTPPPVILEADARELPSVLKSAPLADLVLTSPPYGGTYDYAQHHALRYPWLGVSAERFERLEIGARRHLSRGRGPKRREENVLHRWHEEVLAALKSMAQRLTPEGVAIWVMGDGEVGGRRVPADEQLRELAPRADLRLVAGASQERPDWGGGGARREHLLALRRVS